MYFRFSVVSFDFWQSRNDDNDGNIAVESGMVETVGVTVGISLIPRPMPNVQCTSGLLSSILTFGSRALADIV